MGLPFTTSVVMAAHRLSPAAATQEDGDSRLPSSLTI
jgi:hypothetical protein